MGYGSRSLELLVRYFQGEFIELDQEYPSLELNRATALVEGAGEGGQLKNEVLTVRESLPPLLLRLNQVPPLKNRLHWVGVSFGLTASLHRFWKRSKFSPVYLRHTSVILFPTRRYL